MMEPVEGKSLDLVKENILQLKKLFPEVVTEGKIDFDKLKLLLGEEIEERQERYEFTWHGKIQAMKLAQTPSTGTLRPDKASSKNWDTTENLFIEGDNLEVLKLLQKAYFGKIKMIYIDPPYNTGKDFVYKDDYRDNIKNYKEMTNQTTKANPETSGRYHTDWLNMMYPRLKLARNLLRDDGLIFISIDDHEYHNLKKMCDEIFGEENFLACFVWKRRASSAMAEKLISVDHEYIICYQRSDFVNFKGIEKDYKGYSNPDNDPNGEWTKGDLTVGMTREQRPNQYYDLVDPKTGNIFPADPKRVWAYVPETMNKLIKEGRIIFPTDTSQKPMLKRYKKDLKIKVNPVSTWINESNKLIVDDSDSVFHLSTGLNSEGTKIIQEIFGSKVFDYPKPVSLIKALINQVCEANDIVLDFFAGSGTTGHAIFEHNVEKNTSVKFILVQLPEKLDKVNGSYHSVADIGMERIRRAGEKIVKETGKQDLDIGFKVFKLDSSNLKTWDPDCENLEQTLFGLQDNIKEDRSQEDLLYEILLKIGIPLTAPIEEIMLNGKKIYNVAYGSVLLCLEDDIDLDLVQEMLKLTSDHMETKVVFKETGFVSDAVKTNALQTLKKHGIVDVRSV